MATTCIRALGSITTTTTTRNKYDARTVESKGNAYRTRVDNVANVGVVWNTPAVLCFPQVAVVSEIHNQNSEIHNQNQIQCQNQFV